MLVCSKKIDEQIYTTLYLCVVMKSRNVQTKKVLSGRENLNEINKIKTKKTLLTSVAYEILFILFDV